jgi:predicted glycogen debranching enzyme
LLYAGSEEINLTWMDAVVDSKPVTSRYGFQVEVNALWFNALSFMHELASLFDFDDFSITKQDLLNIKQAFCEVFWCQEKGYLYDFVNSHQKNQALRPNQMFAVSLPFSPLPLTMATDVMCMIKDNLLTPYGLRTLAKTDPAYIGEYAHDQAKRDYAYHNGTVWPWLLGNFAQGLLRTIPNSRNIVEIVQTCLKALQEHLFIHGIGSIAEIFSGDYPHKPNGCISQAWSIAEVLRVTYLLNQYNEV